MALIERAKDADRQQHAGAGVAQSRPRLARPPIALAGDRHGAAAGLGDHVEGETLLVRAAAAEAFDLAIDQPRMQRVHDLPAEPQPLDRAGREILDKDVGAPRHLLDQREAALGFQIDRDRFLVGVVDHEVIRVRAGRRPAAERAPGLAGLRIFDFDNLRAEPGQRFGAGRAGFELGQVENADALETVRLYSIHRLVLLYKNVDPTIEQTGFRLNRIDRPLGSQARR